MLFNNEVKLPQTLIFCFTSPSTEPYGKDGGADVTAEEEDEEVTTT